MYIYVTMDAKISHLSNKNFVKCSYSNAYIQMLIIEWFCIVGQYNFVDEKSNYCSTYIPSLVSWLCKIAEKWAFEYKQLTKILFYKWLVFASTVTYIIYLYLDFKLLNPEQVWSSHSSMLPRIPQELIDHIYLWFNNYT